MRGGWGLGGGGRMEVLVVEPLRSPLSSVSLFDASSRGSRGAPAA